MRSVRRTSAALALVSAVALALPASAETVLRAVVHADLKNIDPIWTTAYITRNHGYMVYDTLFAVDSEFNVQPQMVDTWEVSDNGMTWTFRLRDGLAWHDGAPVTAADCVASIRRWGARDGMGQKLMDVTAALEALDDATFRLTLTQPYGLVLESLSKASSNVLFIMPERHALTDPFEQVPEVIGSGPFVFVADEWVPGARVVYVRNEAYVPRAEPPSWGAGGKVAKVDRVEWLYVPDTATAMNALLAGEIDYFELPPHDLLPIMEASPDVTVKRLDPVGVQGHLRLNHLYPPFDHPKAREAMLWLVEQPRFLRAVVGNEEHWRPCPAYFGCGSPYETDAGAEPLMGFDLERARALLAEAGYDGRPVVLMQPTDVAILSGAALMLAGVLRDAGVNVELQAMDWSTLTSRRALDASPEENGWNIFPTWFIGMDVVHPLASVVTSGGCRERAWFGWPCDPVMEELREAFAFENDPGQRFARAEAVQQQAFALVPYVNFGEWFNPVAFRSNLEGILESPIPLFWNIAKR